MGFSGHMIKIFEQPSQKLDSMPILFCNFYALNFSAHSSLFFIVYGGRICSGPRVHVIDAEISGLGRHSMCGKKIKYYGIGLSVFFLFLCVLVGACSVSF